jgi:hypothetical protein
MLAMINAKRLLNIFAGKRSVALESLPGFNEVLKCDPPLDFLDVINLGKNNAILSKLKATDSVVSVFRTEIVKEFEAVFQPGEDHEQLAEVCGFDPGQNPSDAREAVHQTERSAPPGHENAARLAEAERQGVCRDEAHDAGGDRLPARPRLLEAQRRSLQERRRVSTRVLQGGGCGRASLRQTSERQTRAHAGVLPGEVGIDSSRITRLEKDLAETSKQLEVFRDLESEDNPALASILVFKAYGLMKENPHILWKVLQEKLGRQWFVDVLLDRSKNHKYAIDYEPLEDILPNLNKMLIKEKPDKLDFLAGENADFIRYVVETFRDQMSVCWKSVYDKEILVDKISKETVAGIQLARKEAEVKKEDDEEEEVDPVEDQARKAWEQTKNDEIEAYKKRLATVIAELKNTQSDLTAQSHLNIVLEKRYGLILLTLKEVFSKIGTEADFSNWKNSLESFRKVDAKTLQSLGVDKAIASKKMEMLAKLVIQSTAVKSTVNKSTSTNTGTYTDIHYDEPDLMGVLISKIKTVYPGKMDGKSGYEGSRYSKSNRMMIMNSQASRFQLHNDKKKPNSNFNLPRKPIDQTSYRNDMSYYDGSVHGSYDELGEDQRYAHHGKHPSGRLGSDLEDAHSPRSKNGSIDTKTGQPKYMRHNPHISNTGKIQYAQGFYPNTSSRTLEDELEFPHMIKGRHGYPRRSEVGSMIPSLNHTPDKAMTLDKFIEMSNTDKKRSRGDSAGRKMSMFVSRDEVEHLNSDHILPGGKSKYFHPSAQNSSGISSNKKANSKSKDAKTKHIEGGLNDFLTVANIKQGIALNSKDLPKPRLDLKQKELHDDSKDHKKLSPIKYKEPKTRSEGENYTSGPIKDGHSNVIGQSSRQLEGNEAISGEIESRDTSQNKIDGPSSKPKRHLFELTEAQRETPESEMRQRPQAANSSRLDSISKRDREGSKSLKKKHKTPRLDMYLLDALQIGLTQDSDAGLYLKIISNHHANHKLLGSKSKVVEAHLKGPQNFLIYLSKRPGSKMIRQAERRLLELLDQKTAELEKLKSRDSLT